MRKFVLEDLLAAGFFLLIFSGGINFPSLVTKGPRLVVIVRESEDDSPEFARMVTNLRNGDAAKTLEAGKHQLDVLDDEAAGKWLPALEGVKQPAVLVVAPPDKVLAKQSLAPDATAETVLSILKANGG